MKYPLFFLLLYTIAGPLYAQPFTTFNFSLEEGLPSSEVYQVYQDKEGFIWFATDNGIAKYDGKEIKTYHIKDGLTDPVVFRFQEDEEGRVWFISYSGRLSYYENGQIKKYKFNDKISEVVENGIPTFQYEVKSKKLKILSKKNLAEIDSMGNLQMRKVKEEGLHYYGTIEAGIWSLTTHSLDSANIFINEKLFKTGFSSKPYQLSNYLGPARCIQWRGKLYLTIRNNIYCYDGQEIKRVYAGRAPIIGFSIDMEDNLWIGYLTAGAERHTKEDFSNPETLPILNKLSVSGMLEDKEKGLWISTLEKGVYYIPDRAIKNLTPASDSKIMHVITRGDSIFKSNQHGEFQIINSTTNEILWEHQFNALPSFFYLTRSGILIILSGPKTYFFNSSMQIIREYPINAGAVIEQPNGGFWIYGDGAIREFNKEGDLLNRTKLNVLYRYFVLHDSLFYMAGRAGLHIRDKNLALIDQQKNLENFKISGLISLNTGKLLVTSLGSGLILLDTKSGAYQKFDTEHQFIANNIYTAVKNNDTLWLGTEAGLIIVNIESLLNGLPEFRRWDKKNGLIANDIKHLGITTSTIWAFSDNGYSVIPISKLQEQEQLPKPYIADIQINDSVYNGNPSTLLLPYNKTNIAIKIGFLSFDKQDIESRYRISKKDQWIYTKERTFQFNSLAPANYEFELEYTIDHVNWIPAEFHLPFSVSPPWWQQWYFQVGIISIIIVIILLYTRRQVRNYKQKNHYLNVINIQQQKLVKAEVQITERERKRIAKELHDGVGTDLVLVKLKVMELLSKNGNRESTKGIDEHFNETIQEIRNISYGLTPPDLDRFGLKKTLSNYINKLSISVDTVIHLDFDGEVPKGEVEISIFRVLQELINNTLKHARAKNIVINIQASQEVISISYIDDGIGFSYNKINHGLGLANIESRIQSIGGRINFESNHTGTTYLIQIPEAI